MTPNAQIVNLPPPAVVKDQLTSKNQGPESDRGNVNGWIGSVSAI